MPAITDTQLEADGYIVTGELNCDAQKDVVEVSLDGSPRVWYANGAGGLIPASQLVVPPAGGSRRLLSGDADADARPEPLLLVDRQLYRIPNDGSSTFQPLLSGEVSAQRLVGTIASGNWDSASACGEIALAERAANLIHIYSLCAGAGEIASVALPADQRIGGRGLFASDVDGDGREDLLASTGPDPATLDWDENSLYVSYGVGDGTFDDSPNPHAGARGSGRTAPSPLTLASGLLSVAELDGDGRADYVLEDRTLFSRRESADCTDCTRPHAWIAAAASDFNRDGYVDLVGMPLDARELHFAMGLGGGAFNEFSVPTEGTAAFSVFAQDHLTPIGVGPNAAGPLFAVGDFNGDLSQDFAFVERLGREPNSLTLSVLFGVPLGVPAAAKHIASLAGISDLAAGALFKGPNTLSDLVLLGKNGKLEGVGLYAGKTDRLLSSPLALPNDPASRQPVKLVDLALGHFRADDRARCPESSEPALRKDMVLLARGQAGLLLYFFEASAANGFDTSRGEEPLRLPETPGRSELTLTAIDVDGAAGDGIDEVVLFPSCIAPGPFQYWLARRGPTGFSLREFTLDVRGFQQPMAVNEHWPRTARLAVRDVTSDGSPDLVLWAGRFELCDYDWDSADFDPTALEDDAYGASYVVVFPNRGNGQLEPGAALAVAAADDATFVNADRDPTPELAVAAAKGILLFDVSLETAQITPLTTLGGSDETWWRVGAGDFDGNGVEDIVAIPLSEDRDVQVFWSGAQPP